MLIILGNNTEKDFCDSQSYCSIKQYTHTDPIQQHFHQAPAALVSSVFSLCVGIECVCGLFCLFLFLIILPLQQCPLRSPFSFCPQIPFYPCFSSFSNRCSSALCISPTILCTFVTAHITAGACLCLVRGFQFPYITLRIPVLFDFGLHDLSA